jgi:hypothetical protein
MPISYGSIKSIDKNYRCEIRKLEDLPTKKKLQLWKTNREVMIIIKYGRLMNPVDARLWVAR